MQPGVYQQTPAGPMMVGGGVAAGGTLVQGPQGGLQGQGAVGVAAGAGGLGHVAVAGQGSTRVQANGAMRSSGGLDCTAGLCGVGSVSADADGMVRVRPDGTVAAAGDLDVSARLCGVALPTCGADAACGAGTGCSAAAGPAVMTFVGTGAGDYVTETSYKYVGQGAGIYGLVAPRRSLVGYYVCAISVVILLVVAALLYWPGETTTTTPFTTSFTFTTTPAPPPKPKPAPRGSCVFWGDPHVVTFDKSRPSFYGEGERWIVKSKTVHIQGLYLGTEYTHGLSATNKVVVGGPFLQGHKIEVGTLESGELTVDGQSVLASFPSTYRLPHGLGTITYSAEGELVDRATASWPKRAVHMALADGVAVTVFRWKNYLDLKIDMQRVEGMDGACGNFNNDASDDTTQQIMQRVGVRVSEGERMFANRHAVVVAAEMAEMIQRDCPKARVSSAQAFCRKQMPHALQQELASCLYDECFGQMDHAQRTAKQYA